ncbi:MAG: cell surface protein [Bacteroidaceae bacterium]|nr:cell surface protein [Bacteroidaceae bacterium]
MKTSIVYRLLFVLLLLSSCSDKENPEEEGALPTITFSVASARYRMELGSELEIVPVYENVDASSTYTWSREGQVVSTEPTYTFVAEALGEYYVQLKVTNRYGATEDELKVTVIKVDEVPENVSGDSLIVQNDSVFAWKFPWTSIHVATGRTVKVKAYMIENDLGGTYTWTQDGSVVAGPYTQDEVSEVSYVVNTNGMTQGAHSLQLTMQNDTCTASQTFTIHVCPTEGTYRRAVTASSQSLVNQVYEYMPAPGHQVNGYSIVGDFIHDGATMEEACEVALEHFRKQYSVSLGAQGGYLIAGFDHSVENSGGDYDLVIRGNPFSYQSEPGIIWVSQDVNGDGLPNDTWYELAGSEYGTENSVCEYAITYYKPSRPQSATPWKDNFGNTGIVPYMTLWNTHAYYWQDWVGGTEHTYFGTRLKDTHTYSSGYTMEYPFDWGYADNLGSDYFKNPNFDAEKPMGYFKISRAKTWDGQDANLQYIDFVKVQTAQTGYSPNLGDISTEVYCIYDYHIAK